MKKTFFGISKKGFLHLWEMGENDTENGFGLF